MAQTNQPCEGDWVKLIAGDKSDLDISLDDVTIANMNSEDFTDLVKSKVRQNAFKELRQVQERRIQVQHIQYDSLREPKEYLLIKH